MAEEAFALGNQEFVKENWKGALDHFSRYQMFCQNLDYKELDFWCSSGLQIWMDLK